MKEFLETLTQLGDHQHLRREKAGTKIVQLLQQETTAERELIMIAFFK